MIVVRRKSEQDAIQVAAAAAKRAGKKLEGNLRWHGDLGPCYREIGTKDGETIRVLEPKR